VLLVLIGRVAPHFRGREDANVAPGTEYQLTVRLQFWSFCSPHGASGSVLYYITAGETEGGMAVKDVYVHRQ
jgi:hypothetical protein